MFRISLREVFLLVAAVGVAIVSLIYASLLWLMLIGLAAALAAILALIIGLVDRGPRRAFPIGFAVAMLGYLCAVLNAQKFMLPPGSEMFANQNVELDPYNGKLPTSAVLRYLYCNSVREYRVFDLNTGARIPESEIGKVIIVTESPEGLSPGSWVGAVAPGQRGAYSQTRPPGDKFMAIGHFWWALMFGYIGGKFARFISVRRNSELIAQV